MPDFYSWQKADKKFSDVMTGDGLNHDFDYLNSYTRNQPQNQSIFEQLQQNYNNRESGKQVDGFQTSKTRIDIDKDSIGVANPGYAYESAVINGTAINGQLLDDYEEDFLNNDVDFYDSALQENRLRNLKGRPNSLLDQIEDGAKKVVEIKYSLVNRIIWIISTIILIGSVVFYFSAVQPSAFNLLHSVVLGKIDKMQKSHVEMLQTAKEFRDGMNKTLVGYPVATDCSLQQPIDFSTFEENRFESLINNEFQPDPELLTLYSSESFKYNFFANSYIDLYENYKQNSVSLGQTVENYSYLPSLLEYQNAYVESCKLLMTGQFRTDVIAAQCENLKSKVADTLQRFVELEIPPTSKVSTAVNNSIQDCGVQPNGRGITLTSNIAKWRDSFYLNYQDFMDRKINFTPFDESINRIESDFAERLETVRNSINKEYQNKQKGFPNIYILQPNLNSKTFKLPFTSK